MLQPLLRALSQLSDPVLLGVTLRSLLLSLLAFVAVCVGWVWLLETWLSPGGGQVGWLGWLVGLLGAFGAGLVAIWFYVPVALLIATLFIDRVADAVERRYYPGLPRARGAGLAEQVWDGAALGLQVAGLQLVALVLTIVLPGIGFVLGYVVTGWAIGRGLFVGVAMRRAARPVALLLYRQRRLPAVGLGILFALAGLVPPLNLLVPVVGIAAMVHVLHDRRVLMV